ncbi:MAG: hypothetical protein WBG92_12595 [Thiohalocapsa sp.]
MAELSWALETLGISFGIALNPDQPLGIDFAARDVEQLAAMPKLN